MAIVKAKHIRGKSRIKAHLRYITHRRGMEGERMTRPLFGRDGALSKLQIYDMIDAAKRGAVFHKFVINFHPVKEDTRKDLNLWELTRKTLEHIKTQFGNSVPFVATIHDDHTLLRHIHGFFIVEGRLSKEEFAKIKGLWKVASAEAWRQRTRLDRMHTSLGFQKTDCRLSKITNANTSRGGEGGCETSGCSRHVNTAAMAISRHPVLSVNLPRLQTMAHEKQTRISIILEGGCTGNAHAVLQDFLAVGQLACSCVGYFPQTFPRPLRI